MRIARDPIASWLRTRCIRGPAERDAEWGLQASWAAFCHLAHPTDQSWSSVAAALLRRGCQRRGDGDTAIWLGVSLRTLGDGDASPAAMVVVA